MKSRGQWIQRSADRADLQGEILPGQSIVEIAGDCRVLIERHGGVREYSREQIRVCLSFGSVCVRGQNLELTCMTHQQLVITGIIDGVFLQREDSR